MGLSSLIKTTPVWVVLLQTSGSSLQGEKEDWRGVYVWRGRLRRVEEGIPFNCNHSGSTAGNYMPCIQLDTYIARPQTHTHTKPHTHIHSHKHTHTKVHRQTDTHTHTHTHTHSHTHTVLNNVYVCILMHSVCLRSVHPGLITSARDVYQRCVLVPASWFVCVFVCMLSVCCRG